MDTKTHAILIEGGDLESRSAKAFLILKEFFSDDPGAVERLKGASLEEGSLEDLIVLDSDDGKDITVGVIEELISRFKQKPLVSKGKACVIKHGERLNEQAQNKLLKQLEEPKGEDLFLIMTENAQRLLPTVRSRLMRIWIGYANQRRGPVSDDIRKLTAILIYGKDTLAEANALFSRYEGSRDEAAMFLGAFQVFLRSMTVGRFSAELISGDACDEAWLRESAVKIKQKHALRMQKGVMLLEEALLAIERGDRIRNALRGMALTMRA